jgi:hypothetical protein
MMRILLSAAFLGIAWGCSPKAPALIGSMESLSGIEGTSISGSTSFRGAKSEAQAVARILLAGRSCDNLKYQGLLVFDLCYADGRKQSVEVTQPKAVVRIDGAAYAVDMKALLAILNGLPSGSRK